MKTKTFVKTTKSGNLLPSFVKKTFNYTLCGLVVAAFLFMPFTFDTGDLSIGVTAAFAKDGKDKGGKDKGGGGGRDKNQKDNKISKKGNAYGHTKEDNLEDDGETTEKINKLLGRLNAAHSSQTARDNASENSAVGMIETYRQQLEDIIAINKTDATDEEKEAAHWEAIRLLEAASNKPVDGDVADAVNLLLLYQVDIYAYGSPIDPDADPDADADPVVPE